MADAIIETLGLTKTYGRNRGIEDVTFAVRRGEVFGFLGPNGAGKTTTMRILVDLLRPTSGEARVFGIDVREAQETHARIGYLPGELGWGGSLSAREHLAHLASLRGGVDENVVDDLVARLGVDLDKPVRSLSRGNKQKVGLVQALMHEPELLILDEPTGGLDPLVQQTFNDIIRERAAGGTTVFLSSHILPEVEALCDRVGIIRSGRLVAIEHMQDVKRRAVRRVRATFSKPPDPDIVRELAGVSDLQVEGHSLRCSIRGDAGPLVRALATPALLDLVTNDPSLEDAFFEYYEEGA